MDAVFRANPQRTPQDVRPKGAVVDAKDGLPELDHRAKVNKNAKKHGVLSFLSHLRFTFIGMKEQLQKAGFQETQTHLMVLKNDRFEVTAFETIEGWVYKWKDIIENCGGGPDKLINITQINFYL
jgi:hypothetical protein